MKPADFDGGQGEDGAVDQDVREDGREEEGGFADMALLTLCLKGLLPKGRGGNALQRDHEEPEEEPADGDGREDLEREADVGVLEEPPVEGEDGELGKGDGKGVGHARAPDLQPGIPLLVGVGEVLGEVVVHRSTEPFANPYAMSEE